MRLVSPYSAMRKQVDPTSYIIDDERQEEKP
jgi:hypothetical protein